MGDIKRDADVVLEADKCQFVLKKKKKRQCRLTPMKNEVLCGEHIIHSYKADQNLEVPTNDTTRDFLEKFRENFSK